jgi:hypothetical protein
VALERYRAKRDFAKMPEPAGRRLASLSADPWERYDEARASLTPAIEALVEASPPKRRRPRALSRSGT